MTSNTFKKWICITATFIIILVGGLTIYKDYGFNIDETANQIRGIVSLNYIGDLADSQTIKNDSYLKQFRYLKPLPEYRVFEGGFYGDAEHGPIFNLVAVTLQQLFQIGAHSANERERYQFNHLLIFILFLLSCIAIFTITERRFKSYKLGLLAVIFLVLSPRIFADAFYNHNDIAFLSLFIIAADANIRLLINPTSKKAAMWAGVSIGLAIDVRVGGIILSAIIVPLYLYRYISINHPSSKLITQFVIYTLSLALTIYIFWPWLWEDPIQNFLTAWKILSKVPQYGSVLFFGDFINQSKLPWYYVPGWILITTPILYSILWVLGIALLVKKFYLQLAQQKKLDLNHLQDLFFVMLFLGPISATIILNSVIFDGWRHLYFTYPFFILTVIYAINALWSSQKTTLRYILIAGIIGSCIFTSQRMIALHPFQNIYFNFLAGKDLKNNFDLDYWWLTADSTLQWIDQNYKLTQIKSEDPPRKIRIFIPNGTYFLFENFFKSLPILIKDNFLVVKGEQVADYIYTNHRINSKNYIPNFLLFSKILDIKKDDEVIATIFINRNLENTTPMNSLDFAKNSMGTAYLIKGWSHPEFNGTWSDGQQASILLPMPKKNSSEIILNLSPFVTFNHPIQKMNIEINGQIYLHILTKDTIQIVLPIDEQSQKDQFIKINFEFLSPVSPVSVNYGEDTRILGIKLHSITFKEKTTQSVR